MDTDIQYILPRGHFIHLATKSLRPIDTPHFSRANFSYGRATYVAGAGTYHEHRLPGDRKP